MRAAELKAFLKEHGLRPEDVATGTDLGTKTIYRFLNGENVSRVTARLIAEFVASKSKESPEEPKRSTG